MLLIILLVIATFCLVFFAGFMLGYFEDYGSSLILSVTALVLFDILCFASVDFGAQPPVLLAGQTATVLFTHPPLEESDGNLVYWAERLDGTNVRFTSLDLVSGSEIGVGDLVTFTNLGIQEIQQ